MKLLPILALFISLQAFGAINWTEDVDFDFPQAEKGKVLGDQILIVYYKKCQAQKTMTWKEVESGKLSDGTPFREWMVEKVKEMDAGGKCD